VPEFSSIYVLPGTGVFLTASKISELLMHYDEEAGKDWLHFDERNGFRGTCPKMLQDSGWGRGQSLKFSGCERSGEREIS
jgi:hypothetical protein